MTKMQERNIKNKKIQDARLEKLLKKAKEAR